MFSAAKAALGRWEQFNLGWVQAWSPDESINAGGLVAVAGRSLGLWWLNACRIVYLVDEMQPRRRFGFAYGTLPGHVECGEERFLVEWREDDTVWYDVRAFSRPRLWAARIAYPLTRLLQKQFARDSRVAMPASIPVNSSSPPVFSSSAKKGPDRTRPKRRRSAPVRSTSPRPTSSR